MPACIWNKTYRREILIEARMQADERLTIGEDTAVVYPAAMLAKKIMITGSCSNRHRQKNEGLPECPCR